MKVMRNENQILIEEGMFVWGKIESLAIIAVIYFLDWLLCVKLFPNVFIYFIVFSLNTTSLISLATKFTTKILLADFIFIQRRSFLFGIFSSEVSDVLKKYVLFE